MVKIAPSILSADFSRLGETIKEIEKYADILHFDVMDGHFVPNISFGIPVIESLRRITTLPFDIHLMISNPDFFAPKFTGEIITVHIEATQHIMRVIDAIKSSGRKIGVAINPGTSIYPLQEILDIVDVVLVMSVNPGFGGQEFIKSTLKKIERLRDMKENGKFKFEIEVDGGIKDDNVKDVILAGAEIIVIGSYIFSGDIKEKIIRIKEKIMGP